MADRVAVFIDYQNVYMGARSAFFPTTADHRDGQVHPTRLALVLCGKTAAREVSSVNVYRGLPSSKHDPRGYAAAYRQVSLWQSKAGVKAVTRPLNYRDPHHPHEKGIDVQIAIDIVMLAQKNAYDVGILFSGDTDLLPAVEAVLAMRGNDQCFEVAAWRAPSGRSSPLRVKGHVLHTHLLARDRYELVHDDTDYTMARRRR